MNAGNDILCQPTKRWLRGDRLTALLFALFLLALLPAGVQAQATVTLDNTVAAWSPDSGSLAVGAADGSVRVLDTATWRSLVTLKDLDERVVDLTWSPDGAFLAGIGAQGTVQVWDTETWRILTTLAGAAPAAPTDAPADAQDEEEDAPVATDTAEAPAAETPAAEAAKPASPPAPAAAEPARDDRDILDVSGAQAVSIEAAAGDTDQYYRLQTAWLEDENKCFEGGRPDPDGFLGGAAYMDDCQDVSGQRWAFVPVEDGYYKLQTEWLQDENKCLEGNQLDPARFLAGAAYMDDCEDVTGQLWAFVPAEDGYYQLQTQWLEGENKCLEGNRPGPEWILEGAAHMADCSDVSGQLWKIIPADVDKPAGSASAPARAGAAGSPGELLTFEAFGSWRRGDQPYATFAQSSDPVHGGASAGKLSYDFAAASAADDFVVFTQRVAVAGEPNLIQAWVHGDGSGHLFNIWVEDANGEVWSVPMGAVTHTGWQQMSGAVDANAPWPGGRVYGPENGAIDYPIRLLGLVVDRTDGPARGEISFDDISVGTGDAPVARVQAPSNADPCADIPAPTQGDVMVRFVNTSDDPLIVTWVDFNGDLDPGLSTVVGPNDFFNQESFPTHEWAILDLAAQRLDTFVVGDAQTQCALIP